MAFFGFSWFKCDSCETTQKLLTEHEYNGIDVTYDPGMYIENVATVDQLRRELSVGEKVAFIENSAKGNLRGKNFLDIGCGLGGFLLAARELGMVATGFEPSRLHYSALEEVCPGEFNVINDYFHPEKCTDTYDVIMLSHVIEHIYNPGSFLQGIASRLKPGGVLIVVTPNNESVEAANCGKRWLMYKSVDHVSVIGPTAAGKLTPSGCCIEKIESDEYRGEFAVHAMSAVKTALGRRQSSGVVADGERPRKQISAASFPTWMKTCLQILSFPFWLYGKSTNGLACMTVVYRRTAV